MANASATRTILKSEDDQTGLSEWKRTAIPIRASEASRIRAEPILCQTDPPPCRAELPSARIYRAFRGDAMPHRLRESICCYRYLWHEARTVRSLRSEVATPTEPRRCSGAGHFLRGGGKSTRVAWSECRPANMFIPSRSHSDVILYRRSWPNRPYRTRDSTAISLAGLHARRNQP